MSEAGALPLLLILLAAANASAQTPAASPAAATAPAGSEAAAAPTSSEAAATEATPAQAAPAEVILEPRATPAEAPPAAPAPAPATPPVAPPPTPPASLEPRAAVNEPAAASVSREQFPHDLNLELGLAMNGRFGDASGYSSGRGLGAAYGFGVWFSLSRSVALGLELSRADLGRGEARSGSNFVTAEYATSAAVASGRFTFVEVGDVRLFAALRLGLALQHVAAYGVRSPGSPFEAPTAFNCSGTHGPAFALGAGLGALVHLNSHLDFVSRLDGHVEQLTSDVVGGCAAGVGSATSLALGVGLAYGFDGPKYSGDPFAARSRVIGSR